MLYAKRGLLMAACAATIFAAGWGCAPRIPDKVGFAGRAADLPQREGAPLIKKLPLGFEMEAGWLRVQEDFPSPSDPHRILRVLQIRERAWNDEQEAHALAELRDKASKVAIELGGNGYVAHGTTAWIVHVSAAKPTWPDPALWLRSIVPPQFKEERSTSMTLEEGRVKVAVKKGHCYGVSWALAPDAELTMPGSAMWYLTQEKELAKGPPRSRGNRIGSMGHGIPERTHFTDLGCAGASGTASYKLEAHTMRVVIGNTSPEPDASEGRIGRGAAAVKIYSWAPSPAALHSACTVCREGSEGSLNENCLEHRDLSSGICE